MSKYTIEGGIDFYSELYKSLDDEYIEDSLNDDNRCLITNEPLTDYFVELKCGHKFNYIPLYNDLVNHRKNFNKDESRSERLSGAQIRCPYCRCKHSTLLNYYECLGLKKEHGVNHYEPPAFLKANDCFKCEFVYSNPNYNPNEPESVINSPYLNQKVCHMTGSKICIYNSICPEQPINYGDTKFYCYEHKKIMIKHYKAVEKEKEKKLKKEAKAQAKAEKLKVKAELKKNLQNVVLGPSDVQVGCVQILKTGPNKGKQCGCKIFSNNLCKRHNNKN